MNAKELSDILQICPTKPVRIHLDWDNEPEVDGIAVNSDHVLIGHDLPPEVYEADYRYERA
jgi:hypothetical protein